MSPPRPALAAQFFVGWNCHPCHSIAYRFSSDNASETQTPAGQQYPIGLSRVANANTAAAVAPSAATNVKSQLAVGIDAGPRRRMAKMRAMLKGIAIGNTPGTGSRSAPIDTIAAAMTTSPTGSLLLTQRHHHQENG
jgi:hypothetical protein